MTEFCTLSSLVESLRVAKLAANRRPRYVTELVRCLNAFVLFCDNPPVSQVTSDCIERWLLETASNPWTRATHIARVSTLFEFARRRRMVQENPCFYLERVTIDQEQPTILSPYDAQKLWNACIDERPSGSAWMALALYAGLRPEEAAAITWDDVDFEGARIFVSAATSKVRRRRIVEPPAKAFVSLLQAREAGGILPISNSTKKRLQVHLRERMGWTEWPKDILRHTCASNWLAVVPDAARIALQLGNSPNVLMRHYRAAVMREDAVAFWAIPDPTGLSSPADPAAV